MRKVACPSCQASYDVDERRIPANGMKMRCPKCSASFQVAQDGTVSEAGAPPPPPKPRIAPPVPPDADLPAPKGAFDFGELDLPAPKAAASAMPGLGELDLPVPKPSVPAQRPSFDFGELDLPVPKGGAVLGDELDLPAPKAPSGVPGLGDLDLPAPKRAGAVMGFDDLDLPVPKGASPFGDLDLPVPKSGGGAAFDGLDLPAPKASGSSPFGELDLPLPKPQAPAAPKRPIAPPVATKAPVAAPPAPKRPIAPPMVPDLPVPAGAKRPIAPPVIPDLPTPAGRPGSGTPFDFDLPAPVGVDLPAPVGADLPAPKGAFSIDFGELDLDRPSSPPGGPDLDLPTPKTSTADPFGELDLGSPSMPPDEFALPEPRARAVGGSDFGELDLGGEEDLEFGGLAPGVDDSLPALDDAAPIVRDSQMPAGLSIEERKALLQKQRKQRFVRAIAITSSVLVLGGGAGFALKYTKYGIFGQYAVESFLPAAGSPASAASVARNAEERAKTDAFDDVRASLGVLATARRAEGVNRALLTRSLVHEALYRHRFGDDVSSTTRGNALLARLRERSNDAPGIDLALAAESLRAGDLGAASNAIARARRTAPNDAYVDLVAGEIELALGRHAEAAARFRGSLAHGGAARAQWGLARALVAAGDDGAAEAVAATLVASPRHVEARTSQAMASLLAGDLDAGRVPAREASGLDPVDGRPLAGSRRSRARALTVLGRIEEMRSHRSDARFAYESAAALDGGNVDALLGAGRVLLEESMAREALVRFESAIASESTDPSIFETGEHPRSLVADARLGAVDALLLLERPQDASVQAAALLAALPEDDSVALAVGRVQHALHDDVAAEASFRRVIELAPTRFEGYLALSQLFFDMNRPEDAVAALAAADGKVEVTVEVRRLEGEAELRRGQYAAARAKFSAALELDANDRASLFGLGVAHRREGSFAESARTFDRLAELDASYPGLALERGEIYESQGQIDRAVTMFERAVRERPDDRLLAVRLGGAQVAAGLLDEAQATLDAVIALEATNALAIHYKGRLAIARGEYDAAIQLLQDAVRLEAGRAEFHAFLALAYLEKSALADAQTEIQRTLELDERSVDGHILRARLYARTGRVADALREAGVALAIDPRRTEIWAVVGECQSLLSRRPEAIEAYRAALAGNPNRGDWWSRLARVQLETGDLNAAVASYRRAIAIDGQRTPTPGYLLEVLRGLGDTLVELRDRAGARSTYERFLELAPAGTPGRAEVERSLQRL